MSCSRNHTTLPFPTNWLSRCLERILYYWCSQQASSEPADVFDTSFPLFSFCQKWIWTSNNQNGIKIQLSVGRHRKNKCSLLGNFGICKNCSNMKHFICGMIYRQFSSSMFRCDPGVLQCLVNPSEDTVETAHLTCSPDETKPGR